MSHVQYLARFTPGPIPTELGQLGRLDQLYLGYNAFCGQIPTEFGLLHSLKELDLEDNELTGN